ncbi:MAG TPA: hypothetical protein PK993_00200 [Clostridia bacterium]|nr:hypothetical protein [Clostridia bacterium]
MNKHFKSIPESISKSTAQNENNNVSNNGQKKSLLNGQKNNRNVSSDLKNQESINSIGQKNDHIVSSDLKNQDSRFSIGQEKNNVVPSDLKNQDSNLTIEKIKNWSECAILENSKAETTVLLIKWLLQATDISYFSSQAFSEVRNVYRKRNNLSNSLYFQIVLDFLDRKKGDLNIQNYKYKSFCHGLMYDVFVSACRNFPKVTVLEKFLNLALELDMNLKIAKKDIVFLTKLGVNEDILNRYQLMF